MFIDTHISASLEDDNSKQRFQLISKPLKGEKVPTLLNYRTVTMTLTWPRVLQKNFNSVFFY